MAPSSPSPFLFWKFPEIGGRNAVVSRGRWQSKMHASLCSSRGHTEVIQKIRLAIVLHVLHSLQTNCRIRLFPVPFWGWITVFAECSVHKSTTLVCGSDFGFLQSSSPSTHSQPSKIFYFSCCNNFHFYSSEINIECLLELWLGNPLSRGCSGNQAKESCTNTFVHSSP